MNELYFVLTHCNEFLNQEFLNYFVYFLNPAKHKISKQISILSNLKIAQRERKTFTKNLFFLQFVQSKTQLLLC